MRNKLTLGNAYIRFAFENDAYFRVIFSIQPKSQAELKELPEGGGYNLLHEAVVEAIVAGTIKGSEDAAYPLHAHADLVSMYLWSLTHGLVTLTLSGACEAPACESNLDPNQLMQAFAPFVNYGIRERGEPAVGNEQNEERCQSE